MILEELTLTRLSFGFGVPRGFQQVPEALSLRIGAGERSGPSVLNQMSRSRGNGRNMLERVELLGMSMNIKNEEAHRLARELAALTGESITTAVLESLRERLDRVGGPAPGERAELMLAIGRRTAPLLEGIETDHDRLLYDDRGLPR